MTMRDTRIGTTEAGDGSDFGTAQEPTRCHRQTMRTLASGLGGNYAAVVIESSSDDLRLSARGSIDRHLIGLYRATDKADKTGELLLIASDAGMDTANAFRLAQPEQRQCPAY
ncbi:hypothetical protein [Microtetraspora glauca]|uniref:Uncharacterized protein n=1 Tax=Microtetraspora glauca TaxID=1996 RepID=A0ABV3GSZ7_MICGL